MAWTTAPDELGTDMFGALACELGTTTTAANGEDGVTITTTLAKVRHVFITGKADGKAGPFSWTISGSTITIKATAGAAGDAALVDVMILGVR